MDEATRASLHRSQVIGLTITGRRTGQQRRIQVFLHDEDGLLFILGDAAARPARDWIDSIAADPHVVVHLKVPVVADHSPSPG